MTRSVSSSTRSKLALRVAVVMWPAQKIVVALVLLVDRGLGILELPVFVQRHSGRRIRDRAVIVRVDAGTGR
jgi:hypothetical protein